jgi:hypothetical protein
MNLQREIGDKLSKGGLGNLALTGDYRLHSAVTMPKLVETARQGKSDA